MPVVGPLVGLHFSATPAVDYDTAAHDRRGGLRRGSSTRCSTRAWRSRPGAYEVAFPGLAHTDDVLDEILTRTETALRSF